MAAPFCKEPNINKTLPSSQHSAIEAEKHCQESDSDDDLPDGSCHYFLRERDGNNELQVQVLSTSKEAVGAEPNTTHVTSDEVSSEMEAETSISCGLDGSQMTEKSSRRWWRNRCGR